MKTLSAAALLSALAPQVVANDNGLGLTPPRGWRSWNLYGNNVNQSLITGIMDGMVTKHSYGGAKDTSLCEGFGYCDVGLDDHWQMCGSPDAAPGMNYHDKEGNPIVNLKVFPDLGAMAKHAHSLKLTSGWYGNNCDCSDHCDKGQTRGQGPVCEMQMKQDVAALVKKYDFDAWKLDGCGGEYDLVAINKEIKAAGKPIMVENCHWGGTIPDRSKPEEEGCPWNFYRSSGDVRASYASIRGNLATTIPLAAKNLSYPGCWAYPDMLQVGCAHGPGGAHDPGLSPAETRTHFYSWVIVSSPLTLSHNVNDDTVNEAVWPVITNEEALAVSEAYFGHSGTAFTSSEETVELADAHIEACAAEEAQGTGRVCDAHEKVQVVPASQGFYKPLDYAGKKTAVAMLNAGNSSATLSFNFKDVPGLTGTKFDVRDIHAHKDLGSFTGKWSGEVEGHDIAFLMVTAA